MKYIHWWYCDLCLWWTPDYIELSSAPVISRHKPNIAVKFVSSLAILLEIQTCTHFHPKKVVLIISIIWLNIVHFCLRQTLYYSCYQSWLGTAQILTFYVRIQCRRWLYLLWRALNCLMEMSCMLGLKLYGMTIFAISDAQWPLMFFLSQGSNSLVIGLTSVWNWNENIL